jgi:Tfp pilus assembly protein PilX
MLSHNKHNQGFALLMALVVVSVVISISLSVLDLTIKQLRLSTNSKDSEVAFSAANAGLECARYWREVNDTEIEAGQNINPTCFGISAGTVSRTNLSSFLSSGGTAYQYEMNFTWNPIAGSNRCSRINILVVNSTNSSATIFNGISTFLPGYPGGASATKSCEAGGRCTTISVQGFNRSCATVGSEGTVQREVLLEL